MSRAIHRLPASFKSKKPGMHADGGNLYLQVSENKDGLRRQSWVFRFQLPGMKPRDMGLGSVNDVSLSEAREVARQYRNLVKEGRDPIEERKAKVAHNLATLKKGLTFAEAAEAYIRQHRPGWKNPIHAKQWTSTIATYANPVLGKMSVADITTAHVMKVIEPLWATKTETASRVRGRIESILGWATVSGFRSGENPARWRGHIDNLLAPKEKIKPTKNQPALPWQEMPQFFAALQERTGMASLALRFLITTCVRTADVRHAKVADIDRAAAIWTIPALTKTGKPHKVPLSAAALEAFDSARAMAAEIGGEVANSEFAFPNDVSGAALSSNALLALLDRMERKGAMTSHGCRATFRTWAQEATNFPWELAELSLGHTVGDKVERAYARGDAFKKRIAIMDAWSNYCTKPVPAGSNVTPMRKSA
ncbi:MULTISPECIES: site-specific integrase [unclassified Shinella]|uniref:tyrosine-type recombinase/integrase n=1 Tax=unclassified Shinella TaxID=2643062 RepID=UPI00225D172A|nr:MULTISPECIES: site-specific integrase [unclassified Shinella]MCO5137438.1 integrase arm-type DNA-binding domain-containing protein [Shinella sp.]MDC7257384.1 integrase arm-type DNA-binding domain-containing protein [Shinella sp. YE25]CAI0340274.1 Integrase [Rhizobiaceae bacterium]CAK7258649.1 Integrase [Shinella sp. WSC3-e]